jgi:capsular polysaccharide biosynthesis protein
LDEFPEMAKLPIVMGPVQSRYQVEYLDILGLLDNARFIFRNPSVALSLNQAFYATLVDRPHSSKAVIDWMRGRFIKHAAKIPAGLENGLYYISRGDAGWRKISNEAEIIDFLKGYGFNVIRWTDYSVREQIALANHAKVLIGAHGSNMSNMVYTNPECRVLDIHNQAAGMAGSDWISFMVPTIGGRYYAVVGQNDNPLAPPSIADFAVNLEQFRSVFSQMMDGLN